MKMTNYIWNETEIPTRRVFPTGHKERGIALLLTIFGLLLLTAVAAAMMFSSDSETQIAVNYRDSQVASYAAMAALQEARDRIHPVSGDLGLAKLGYVPTKTLDNGGQVLYIVNPLIGETVQPWNSANAYFDQELCQENTLGLSGTPGSACTTAPAGGCSQAGTGGGGWCSFYDNSANATTWQLFDTNGKPIPMDYKWVRISLKQDKNTPVYVPDPTTATGTTQVCWDGNYQAPLPNNYASTCAASAGNQVIGVNVTAAGSGFASAPTVTISGGGGSGATAVANLGTSSSGSISSVNLSSGGSGYASPPTVSFASTPDGTGATFQAVITGAPITAVTVSNSGSNYCYKSGTTPTINFITTPSTDTLSNATGTLSMGSPGCIASVSQTGTCSAKAANGSASIAAGGPPGSGSNFSGTVTFDSSGNVKSVAVGNVGSGYSAGANNVKLSGGNGKSAWTCNVPLTFTTGSQVSSVSIASGQGGAYMSQPTASLGVPSPSQPTTPTGPTLTPAWSASSSSIQQIRVLTPGSGYLQSSYALTITPCKKCGGSGAAATAKPGSTNIIASFTVTNGGLGYTSNPNVQISGGGGTAASATATIAAGNISQPMGQVYMLTSLAVTKTGARSMAQMETGVRPPFMFNIGGPLTLAGPVPDPPTGQKSPYFNATNSSNFDIIGSDANSCSQGTAAVKPAIGVYDNGSQDAVIGGLPGNRYANYQGAGGTPAVEDVYAAIGGDSLTPSALDGFIKNVQGSVTTPVIPGPATSVPSTTTSSVTYVNGDLTLSGNTTGNGILVVTGTLTLKGDFSWNGLVLVVGQGNLQQNGGGNGNINGAMYVAQIYDASGNLLPSTVPGTPTFSWTGGGTNTIHYDHCLADNLLESYENKPSSRPLQVLSTRMLNF